MQFSAEILNTATADLPLAEDNAYIVLILYITAFNNFFILMSNNLIKEQSPYLLQHMKNPVDWHPWSDETLMLAKNNNVPILLSIGYSSCHWCHVMARESFENNEIAKYMNENFINIKVDREERPDIDALYQSVLSLMGQQGGWPLTMFLKPDLNPFWGGTYFPPQPRGGHPGFPQILEAVADAFGHEFVEPLSILR